MDQAPLRAAELRALGRGRGPTALPELLRALEDPVVLVRVAAVQGLGFLGERAAVGPLEWVLLGDVHPAVRWDAAEALGVLRAREALPTLEEALVDPDERVRRAVAGALGDLGGTAALALLRGAEATDSSELVRAKARRALERAWPEGPRAPAGSPGCSGEPLRPAT